MTALFAATPLRSVLGKGFKYLIDEDDPLTNYSKATFVSYLNSVFQIQTASGNVAVTLTSVDDMPAPSGGECFSLLFVGGSEERSQKTYVMTHSSLGTFQLLLVPAGADENGAQKSVATLNRLPLA